MHSSLRSIDNGVGVQRKNGRPASTEFARGDCRAGASAANRADNLCASSDGVRFALRRIPRGDHLRACHAGLARSERAKIRFLKIGNAHYEVLEVGQFAQRWPAHQQPESRGVEVGYLIGNIRAVSEVHIGDTVTVPGDSALNAESAAGTIDAAAKWLMIYRRLYPSDGQNFELRRG